MYVEDSGLSSHQLEGQDGSSNIDLGFFLNDQSGSTLTLGEQLSYPPEKTRVSPYPDFE